MRALVFAACFVFAVAWGADGDVDRSFGTDGNVVFAPADASTSAFAVAVAEDGRIVIGGWHWAFTESGMPYQAVVWRLLANGAPDLSFGNEGMVVIPTPAGSPVLPAIWSILPLHDGSLLAAGNVGGFGVAHLLADGQLDATFGAGGVVKVAFDDLGGDYATAFAIARDGDDRILLAGSGSGVTGSAVGVVARLSADGILDAQFASAGRFVLGAGGLPLPQAAIILGIASDASDRVWLSGRGEFAPYSGYSALAMRLLADGTPDPAFGSAGLVSANRHAGSDDNIAAGVLRDGHWTIGGICDPVGGPDPAFCLLRIDADGQLDTGFGDAGWVSVPLGQTIVLRNSALACGADGRCVLLGSARDPATSRRQFVVLRVGADGTPDSTFGDSGLARVAVPANVDGSHIIARAIAVQDGRPIPVGTTDGVPYVSALYATRLASNAIFDDGFEAR